jgi:hypothetical protein
MEFLFMITTNTEMRNLVSLHEEIGKQTVVQFENTWARICIQENNKTKEPIYERGGTQGIPSSIKALSLNERTALIHRHLLSERKAAHIRGDLSQELKSKAQKIFNKNTNEPLSKVDRTQLANLAYPTDVKMRESFYAEITPRKELEGGNSFSSFSPNW